MKACTNGDTPQLAKVSPPRAVDIFPRERLFRRLDEPPGRPLVWIAGPPGAGKTTLVASYLAARNVEVLWYRLDATDQDIGSFFHYMALAAPGKFQQQPTGLSPLRPEHRPNLEAFSRRFFEALFTAAPVTLVFDNYHAVPAAARLHDVLRWGLEQMPESRRVVFLSRNDPPSTLARFEPERALTLIGPEDLQLDPDEGRGIARLWPGWKNRLDRVPEMLRRSGGWTAGFILMLENEIRGATATAPPEIGLTTRDSLFRYFAGEIFDHLDVSARETLLKTALLPRITESTARILTGDGQAGEVIARMHQRNYFTERVGGSPPEYRFHPLFQDFLETEAEKTFGRREMGHLRQRTAAACYECGRHEEAAELYRAGRHWRELAELCVELAPRLLDEGRNETLQSWLEALPESTRQSNAWLDYWLAHCLISVDPARAHRLFQCAYESFLKSDNQCGWLSAWAGVVDAITYRWETFQEMDAWIEAMERFEAELERCPSPHTRARAALSMFSALMFRQPEHPRIHEWADYALDSAEETHDPELQLCAIERVSHGCAWFGALGRQARLLRRAEQLFSRHRVTTILQIDNFLQKAIHAWHVGSFDAALEHVDAGLSLARREGIHLLDNRLLAQAVYACASAGNLDEAARRLESINQTLDGRYSLDHGHFHLQRSWLELLRGQLQTAFTHARSAHEQAESAGTPFPIALSGLNFSQIAIACGEMGLARELLVKSERIAGAMDSPILLVQCHVLAAELAREADEWDSCRKATGTALSLMRIHGYNNIAHWDDRLMARFCAFALEQGIERECAYELINRRNLSPPSAALVSPHWPWPVRIRTLGGFALEVHGERIVFNRKAQLRPLELLRVLVALGARDVEEHALADALWPESEGDAAQQSLKITLHRSRKLLGTEDALIRSQGRLSLNPACVWLDTVAFEMASDRAREMASNEQSAGLKQALEAATGLYAGEFLAGARNTIWAEPLREQLEARFGRAVEQLATIHQRAGELEEAAEVYELGISRAPLTETLYLGLIRVKLEQGRIADATHVYRRLESTLNRVLHTVPAPDSQALLEECLRLK